MWRALALTSALVPTLFASPSAAQTVISEQPDAVSVTIYRDDSGIGGFALVTETRTVDLPAGVSRVAFRGVADTLIPQTAAVEGLDARLVERNYDFDLLSPGSLLQASVGRPARLVRTNPATGRVTEEAGVIRSSATGVVLDLGGRVEALNCSGLPEKLVLDELPEGLTDRPTLSVVADAAGGGRRTVRVSYLATGLEWRADYVATLAADGRSLDLAGWITLTNGTGLSFRDAPTDVVAGDLYRDDETDSLRVFAQGAYDHCWPTGWNFAEVRGYASAIPPLPVPPPPPPPMMAMAGRAAFEEIVVTAMARQSELGDYKLYTLPEPTTVAARQTKQVRFLDQRGVPVERVYAFTRDEGPQAQAPEAQAVRVLLRTDNTRAKGLGQPLPEGRVVVMEPAGGRMLLAGQDEIEDIAVGLPVELEIGQAMGVTATPRAEALSDGRDGAGRAQVTVELANAKSVPVTLEYRQASWNGRLVVSNASLRPGRKAGDHVWTLTLAPGERTELSYRLSAKD